MHFATDELFSARPGSYTARMLKTALLKTSKINEDAARKNPFRVQSPAESGLIGTKLVAAYLGTTPLAALLTTSVPLPVTDDIRFEHLHLLAPTGHGKTQTLEFIAAADLSRPPPQVPAMVIIDSKGVMLKRIAERALFARVAARLPTASSSSIRPMSSIRRRSMSST